MMRRPARPACGAPSGRARPTTPAPRHPADNVDAERAAINAIRLLSSRLGTGLLALAGALPDRTSGHRPARPDGPDLAARWARRPDPGRRNTGALRACAGTPRRARD